MVPILKRNLLDFLSSRTAVAGVFVNEKNVYTANCTHLIDLFKNIEYKAEHGSKTRKDSSNSTDLLAFMIRATLTAKKFIWALEMMRKSKADEILRRNFEYSPIFDSRPSRFNLRINQKIM